MPAGSKWAILTRPTGTHLWRDRMATAATYSLRPGRDHAVGTGVGDRLSEVFVLIAEEEPDGSRFGHIHAEELHRRLKLGILLILRIARHEDVGNIGTDFSYAAHQFREEITGMMASETSR